MLGFDQLVDQARNGREAHPLSLPAGGHTQGRRQVRLAGPTFPDPHDRFGPD